MNFTIRVSILALSAAAWIGLAGSPAASGALPDPGYPVVDCPDSPQLVTVVSDSQLDPSCNYSGGIEIRASNVTLDCQGATVSDPEASGAGILVRSPADENMSDVTVRNCEVSGFTNGIRVTRNGFRDLAEGEEYLHALEDVTLENNRISDTGGVGIFVDGYVTDTTIAGSQIRGAGGSGIYLEAGSADNLVMGNEIVDNGFGENGPGGGIETFGGLRFRFWGTGREGISIDGSRRNTITRNFLQGNSAGGIFIYTNCGEYVTSKPNRYFPRRYGATENLVADNHLVGGLNGVWVGSRMGESVLPMECSDQPYFSEGPIQITLDRAADNTISDNTFEGVTYGVRVEDDRTKVTGNSFTGTDGSQYAVLVGTPYRTSVLGEPVSGTELVGNSAAITGNQSPYRWVEGEVGTTFADNSADGKEADFCQSASIPRGPYVMTIAFAYEPAGSPVTPTPDPLGIPLLGPQDPCPQDPPPEPPPPDPPSSQFTFGRLTLNRMQGSATLLVRVPGPGTVRLKGSRTVKGTVRKPRAAGPVRLTVRSRGKVLRKLRRSGVARVKVAVAYTPSKGKTRTKWRQVKLVRKKHPRGARARASSRREV